MLYLFGNGGHSRSITDILVYQLGYPPQLITYVVPDSTLVSRNCTDTINDSTFFRTAIPFSTFHISQASPHSLLRRANLFSKLISNDFTPLTIVSSTAYISSCSKIGAGSFVGPFSYIGPNASIQPNSVVNTRSVVEHDSIIGSSSILATSVTVNGSCHIGSCCFLGSSVHIRDGIHIPDLTTISMGKRIMGWPHKS